MNKALASLTLNLGLIPIPLKLFSFGDGKGLSFNNTCPNCKEAISQKRICPKCNQEIPYDQLAKSLKIGKDRIMVDKGFLESLKQADSEMKVLKVMDSESLKESKYGFELSLITEKHYGLMGKEGFDKQYWLLHSILNLSGSKLLVSYVMRNKAHLGLVKPFGKSLVLAQLIYPEYFRGLPELKEVAIKKEESQLGIQLLESIKKSNNTEIEAIKDVYAEQVMGYLSGEIAIPTGRRKEEKGGDMLALLNASLKGVESEERIGKKV